MLLYCLCMGAWECRPGRRWVKGRGAGGGGPVHQL